MKKLFVRISAFAKKTVPYVDYAVLVTYALMLFCEFSRYIQCRNVEFWNTFYNAYVQRFIVLLVAVKLLEYAFINCKYSVLSAIGIIASFFFNRLIDTKPWLFLTVVLVVSVYRIKFEKVIYTFLIAVGIPFAVKSIGAVIGIFPNELEFVLDRRPRYDFGFTHHNTAYNYFFFIFLAVVYALRKKKVKFIELGIITVIFGIVFYYTDSLSGSLVTVMCLVMLFIDSFVNTDKFVRLKKSFEKWLGIAGIWSVPAAIVISFGGMIGWNYYCYTNGEPDNWNTAFSRFYCMSINATASGLKLPFQYPFRWVQVPINNTPFNWLLGGTPIIVMDNVYGSLLFQYGIIVFFMFVVFLAIWAAKAKKINNTTMLIIAIAITLAGIMEGVSKLYGWNPFLLLPLAMSEVSKNEEVDI